MASDHLWQPSPSPEESWSDAEGANEDGEWPVNGVVGEEIRLDGTSRYEIRWDNWHRWDGSNTTWEKERTFERVELIKQWQKTQKRMRKTLAAYSLDMEVPWPDDAVHKRLTDHQRQAYDEKLERRRRAGSISTADWDTEIEKAYGRLQEPETAGEANSKLRVRRANAVAPPAHSTPSHGSKRPSPALTLSSHDRSLSGGPPSKWSRGRPRIGSTPTSSPKSVPATPLLSRKGTMAFTPTSAGSSKEVEIVQTTLPSIIVSQPTLRGRISSAWNKAAKEVMAATVRISPDIPDENIPRSIRQFKYMEKGYVFSDREVQDDFNVPRGVFTTCDCMTCSDPSSCSCRDLSKIYDLGSRKNFSTYSKGLFAFQIPRGVEVIECNKYCGCDYNCGNRVAQHPRDVGIEIFDTNRYGWGVRALEDIPWGKVFGTYAGVLVKRDQVDELPEEHQGYLFDLDGTEIRNSENLGDKYTVDCYDVGNWTRHSCSPNMKVYSVVYDTTPYVNMPYVAFAASVDILAGTELTIDYHPYAEEDRKGKRRANGGGCRCGSEVCRGWFKL